MVSVATIAAARIAAASISAKLPNRSTVCPRRRENRLTFSCVRGSPPKTTCKDSGLSTIRPALEAGEPVEPRGLPALHDDDQQDAGVNRGPLSCVNFHDRTVS